ncbi:MAG: calcium/sodium antiporter [Candidatus Marinimicrobia bacterium]|jgi:K+-dependent Na+/Ca+ exchanger-like protein|nr:calcium/sodium antiporter [Candidatus Neomarinimicrobiota bacterium]MBT3937101.1 calcium/sodium antiporter [Candidatus Neomarinimicrobiota bacterium]MBT3962071.1 calcium/sodium antiporter [Candidatus Neomarinimicrobiota bacterium]MBT4382439.1 calcium/sodium antiporter [Candidatus Neomarinimicrobiota bacterium]MBT4636556.1 calcium/sodium antiporter [Candidatus Neomarinimicrobiota bacterium]
MLLVYLIIVLIISFYLLARVCDDYFVDSLDRVAKDLKMSSDVAGATLMAIGSSAPEFFVSIISVLKPGDFAEIGIGTIVGSALFNLLVIIGASAMVRSTILTWQPVLRDSIFYSTSIIFLLWAFSDGQISMVEAGAFIIVYIIYVVSVMNWRKILKYEDDSQDELENNSDSFSSSWMLIFKPFDILLSKFFLSERHYIFNFFISIIFIGGLSWVLVESAVMISNILHIPKAIIALTVLAIGTSIPDLISSIIVARQGRGGMAISNALGSNIFDILIGLGIPWMIILLLTDGPLVVGKENLFSSVILLFASVLVVLFILLVRKWKIGKYSGMFLIGVYLTYLIWAISNI